MKSECDFRDSCRICLVKVNENVKVVPFKIMEDLLLQYTSIKIAKGDKLPLSVCYSCSEAANNAFKFLKILEEAENKLQNYYRFTNVHVLGSKQNQQDYLQKNTDNSQTPDTFVEVSANRTVIENRLFIKEAIEDVNTSNAFDDNLSLKYENVRNEAEYALLESEKEFNKDLLVKYEKQVNENSFLQNSFLQFEKQRSVNNDRCYCNVCKISFEDYAKFIEHQDHYKNGNICCICDKSFETGKKLISHVRVHRRRGVYICQMCGKQFTLIENLLQHQQIHRVKTYNCTFCNKSFAQSSGLKAHLLTHTTEKNHSCTVCGGKFRRAWTLRMHIKGIHSEAANARPYECNICSKAFKGKKDLDKHYKIHKEPKHICQVCNKAFVHNSSLKVHDQVHTGLRPFSCSICQKSFSQKHVLTTHLKVHSRN